LIFSTDHLALDLYRYVVISEITTKREQKPVVEESFFHMAQPHESCCSDATDPFTRGVYASGRFNLYGNGDTQFCKCRP
jgi:hypothetical protein